MQYRYVAPIFIACTFATLSPLWTHAQNLPTVIISEISWGGSPLSTADEWIELANTSSAPVDISGWTLSGISSNTLIMPEETFIEPYETYLIANYAMGNEKSSLVVEPNIVTSSISIPNSDLAITLTNSFGEVIDSSVDTGVPDFGSTSPYATAERNLADGTWFTSTPGTPGIVTPTSSFVSAAEEIQSKAQDSDAEIPSEESFLEIEVPLIEKSEASPEVSETALSPELTNDVVLESNVIEDNEIEAITSEIINEDVVSSESFDGAEVTADSESITLIAPITSETIAVATEEPSDISEGVETAVVAGVATITIDYSSLQITEFLSSPSDGSEWVELWNSGNETLSLEGVVIEDASEKVTPLSGNLDAYSYLLVENPAGKLNNTGDTITLRLPDGQILVTLTYGTDTFPAPKKDVSAGACGNGWRISLSPSPLRENSCPTPILESSSYDHSTISTDVDSDRATSGDSSATEGNLPREESADSQGTSFASVTTSVITDAALFYDYEDSSVSSSSQARAHSSVAKKTASKSVVLSVTLAELDTLASGQHVQITDVLAVAPGIFGKRVAYLNGVQLYFHTAEWPELAPGTLIQVTGTWDIDADSRRIKISHAADIIVLGTQALTPISLHDIPDSSAGDLLVTASGTLLRKDGDTFVFGANDGSEFSVVDAAKIGVLGDLRAGDIVTVVGMLFARDGAWILAPRTDGDVVITPETVLVSSPATALGSSESESLHTSSSRSAPLIGGGILASSVSALGYWFVRSRKLSFLFSS